LLEAGAAVVVLVAVLVVEALEQVQDFLLQAVLHTQLPLVAVALAG
jgi:hypothetical protein